MSTKVVCQHDCGRQWIRTTNRQAKRPLDRDAVAAANQATWANCPRLTDAHGKHRELTMDVDDKFCRRVWMEAYVEALDKEKDKKESSPSTTDPSVDPTCPTAVCQNATLVVQVIDRDGKPIKGALVTVSTLVDMTTDQDGLADYGEVAPASYTITAVKDRYLPSPGEPAGPAQTYEYAHPDYQTVVTLKLYPDKASCDFDVAIALEDHSDGTILTPLGVPGYDSTEPTQDYVKFEIQIEGNRLDKLEIEITAGKGSGKAQVFYRELPTRYHAVGIHEWFWDGFSNADILDTKLLKDPHLKLELRAEACGIAKTRTIEFDNEEAQEDWVDVVVNRKTKTVDLELRVDLRDGGENGVGEFPPEGVWEDKRNGIIPKEHVRRQAHIRMRSFDDLKTLALDGLKKYWSRNKGNGLDISTPAGTYSVDTNPVSVTEKSMDDIDLEYNTNGEWERSSNPGTVRGIYSLFGNFLSEHSVYNVGWIKHDWGWEYEEAIDEDNNFAVTSAHEIGHEILMAYGGENYSYGHRGSSTVVTQETLDVKSGGFQYPASGEIDLMKYYNGYQPIDFFSRVVASETDVKSLLWLARVEFDD